MDVCIYKKYLWMYVRIDKYSCVDVKYYMKTKIKKYLWMWGLVNKYLSVDK